MARENCAGEAAPTPVRAKQKNYPADDFIEPSTTQWLQFSDLLRDKRDFSHYQQPRILIQQIFWQGLCTRVQVPTEPVLYLNTILPCITLVNFRFGLCWEF